MLVVDGPPGTGKSQTIVNLVADSLAHGGRVGIVCEKRVALDVVKQRMDSAGLGHLAAVVHDVYDDRKALYTHIANRLESLERRTFTDRKLTVSRTEADDLERGLAVRARLLATAIPGGMSLGELHTLAAGITGPAVSASGLETVGRADLPRLVQGAKELHAYARLWAAESVFRPRNAGTKPGVVRGCVVGGDSVRRARSPQRARHRAGLRDAPRRANRWRPDALEAAEAALKTGASFGGGMNARAFPELPGRMIALRIQKSGKVGDIKEHFAQLEKYCSAAEAGRERINGGIQRTDRRTFRSATARRFIFPFPQSGMEKANRRGVAGRRKPDRSSSPGSNVARRPPAHGGMLRNFPRLSNAVATAAEGRCALRAARGNAGTVGSARAERTRQNRTGGRGLVAARRWSGSAVGCWAA